ncbi:hypothetical protein [Parafrigoribacterium soli]|uniref:hypothetical protein n=1 Tax=Parafrigoribacterium soli TaxID=3144663 RepID=UPI0032EECFF7
MKQKQLFLQADAALRSVIDRIQPAQLSLAAPADWSRVESPTLRDILAAHAFDEAWVPDVLAGRTIKEVGDRYAGDLLGDDAVASYDRLNDVATRAVLAHDDPQGVAHLSYGDFTVGEFFEHTATYRAFQAWSIAKLLGLEYSLPAELVEGLWEHIVPQADVWRAMGVFGPELETPPGADRETELLAKTGFLRP